MGRQGAGHASLGAQARQFQLGGRPAVGVRRMAHGPRIEAAGQCPHREPEYRAMHIRLDDLTGPEIRALLEEHLRNMHELSPPESVHALDLSGLQRPEIRFWTCWDGADLLGCGALKDLGGAHGEVKSMRTANAHRRRGVARAVLSHILADARERRFERLSLETGSQPEFAPARTLYESFGFGYCGPFADYRDDPYSTFMTLALR